MSEKFETPFSIIISWDVFSDTQGQLTPRILYLSLIPAGFKRIRSTAK